ncbi:MULTISPECIES: MBL fold metallo-hydrolase [Arthrobacter]|uniref:MBL fold metallo-hydrolase n=2 Tax=Arthrobacter TaxID=1663 RepID=A0ABU9KNI9_9MICC|nr:MBL fold metallo-hydrolase [Arthrobacter sp. YJM1]MDP5228416.1 MBL fold metallo-hydrolase [Arthrobacter sp. YJM1]
MQLTKFTHSCVRLDKDTPDGVRTLVIDPGTFSETGAALEGAHAVLVTHEHADHLDAPAVVAALVTSPALEVYAPAGAAAALRADAAAAGAASPEQRVHDAGDGLDVVVAGFGVKGFGSQHALIHPVVPLVANTGYLVDGVLFHPGDSFTVPHGLEVDTLLVPIHAPWSKIQEVVDYVISVRPRQAFNIHEALLNPAGLGLMEGHVQRLGARYGTEYRHLDPGEAVQLG